MLPHYIDVNLPSWRGEGSIYGGEAHLYTWTEDPCNEILMVLRVEMYCLTAVCCEAVVCSATVVHGVTVH